MVRLERRLYGWTSLILIAIIILGVADIHMDMAAHASLLHVLVETSIFALCGVLAIYMIHMWRLARVRVDTAETHLDEYLRGIRSRIQNTFDQWQLSRTETKMATLILEGMSHTEIAAHCHRTEGTVRQHAANIYRKAGVNGRTELLGYFLKDVMMPGVVDSVEPPDTDDEHSG